MLNIRGFTIHIIANQQNMAQSIDRASDDHVDSTFTAWSRECVTWPTFEHGEYHTRSQSGESMLELNQEERRALQIIVLMTQVHKEAYGSVHQFNWKKTGLSRAFFQSHRVDEYMWISQCKWYKAGLQEI